MFYYKASINLSKDRAAYQNFEEWARKVGTVDPNYNNPTDITVRFSTYETIGEVKKNIMKVYEDSNDVPQNHDIYIYCYDKEDMHHCSLKKTAHFSNGDWQFDCE